MQPTGRRLADWLAPLATLVVLLVPTLLHGFPRGHDWLLSLTRIAEYGHAVGDGQLPPHWAPNAYGGEGAPVFLFYGPLFLIFASLASLVVSVPAAGVVALWIFAVVGCCTMADLMRSLGGISKGGGDSGLGVAVPLFVLHPYLVTDALLRNADAEFAALCLLALPLAGVVRLASGARGGFWRLALGLALVVLAHNLTALVAAVAVAVLGVVLLWDAGRRVQLRCVTAGIVGLLLSAWLWLPALGYRHLVRLDELTRDRLDFHDNFGPIFGWGAFHAVGWLPAVYLLLAIGWALVRRPEGRLGRVVWTLVAACGVFLLLQVPASVPFWETLPFLPLFQFPWRFQGPLALCIAVLAGVAWARLADGLSRPKRRAIELVLVALLAANAWPHLAQVRPLSQETRADVERGLLTPEGIRSAGLKVTVGDEYLPAPGLRTADLPYGPGRVPPLRSAGLLASILAALAWLAVAIRTRYSLGR